MKRLRFWQVSRWGHRRLRCKTGGFRALVLALLLSPMTVGQTAAAPAHDLHKKVVVVLLDGLALSDITPENTPNLWQMQRIGSVGVMNQNTLGPRDDVNSYLTIGAGAKASAPMQTVTAYGAQERVQEDGHVVTGQDLYLRNTGTAPEGKIVVPQFPQIEEQLSKMNSTFVPGLLGDVVEQLGGQTAVVGNADLGRDVHRPAALLAMNERGTVDIGNLQAGVVKDLSRPYGLRTDMKKLYAAYLSVADRANLIVLETGDLLRLRHAQDLMETAQVDYDRQQTLQDADRLVGMLLPHVNVETMLAVISPTKTTTPDTPPVSPVLLAGGDIEPGGMLVSNTTRRVGLLANYDLAPTFVQFLGGDLRQYSFLGEPIRATANSNEPQLVLAGLSKKVNPSAQTRDAVPMWTIPHSAFSSKDAPLQKVSRMAASLWVTSQARHLLVRPWLNAWIGLSVLTLLAMLFRRHVLRLLQPLAEALLLLPLAWLFVPLYGPDTAGTEVLLSLGITLGVWLMLSAIQDRTARLGLLGGVTALTLIVDVLLGAPLEKQSVLSYDPIVGARYYGIGNEYMGVLIGSLLLAVNALFRHRPAIRWGGRFAALLLFVLVVYLFAAPLFGTNFGGALAATVGFTYALLVYAGIRVQFKHWLLLGLVATGVVGAMALLNLLLPSGEQTHIGRAVQRMFSGEYAAVWEIASRKLALNFLLLRASAWGRLFLLFVALLLVWALLQKWRDETPPLFQARNDKIITVSALAALLCNDSGVVAAALILLYAVTPVIAADSTEDVTPVYEHSLEHATLAAEESQPSQ